MGSRPARRLWTATGLRVFALSSGPQYVNRNFVDRLLRAHPQSVAGSVVIPSLAPASLLRGANGIFRTATGRGSFDRRPAASSPSSSASSAMPALRDHALRERLLALGRWVFRDRQAQRMHKFIVSPKGWIASNDGLDQPQSPLGAPFRAIRPNRRRRHARDPHQAATPDTAKSDLTDSRRQTV